MSNPSGIPRFAHLTRANFNSLATKDPSTFYVVVEISGIKKLYLGDKLLTDAGYELIKDRAATTNLTSITNNSYATLTSNIAVGDTLMVEINSAASYSYNPKIITFTVGSTSTSTSEYNSVTWMTWTGSEQKTYSTFPYFNASYPARLYFSNNRAITGAYTGNNIIYTTATAQTFYVGRIWRVKR